MKNTEGYTPYRNDKEFNDALKIHGPRIRIYSELVSPYKVLPYEVQFQKEQTGQIWYVKWNELLEYYEFEDGTNCGIKNK